MPTKGSIYGRSSEQIQRLAEARARSHAQVESSISQLEVSNLQKQLAVYKVKLEEAEKRCRELEFNLETEQKRSATLSHHLEAEKQYSTNLYQQLRVERQARQRGSACKNILQQQIQLLKSAEASSVKRMKESSSKAINALIKVEKENSSLRSELSKALERITTEALQYREKVGHIRKHAKGYQIQAAKLQKRCSRAGAVQAKAVQKATEKTNKQSSIHRLLHKGIYTEETRSLIWLLVKAGCSRDYISQVIHAVLKTAGISTYGNVSRRTVSRIVVEGYFAAQVQLGHEMKNTKGKLYTYS